MDPQTPPPLGLSLVPDGDQAGKSNAPLSEGVVDLLAVLAYGELTGFMRLAADAEMAPNLHTKTVLAHLAVQEFARFERWG